MSQIAGTHRAPKGGCSATPRIHPTHLPVRGMTLETRPAPQGAIRPTHLPVRGMTLETDTLDEGAEKRKEPVVASKASTGPADEHLYTHPYYRAAFVLVGDPD